MQFIRYLAEDGPRYGVLEEAQVRAATGDPFSGLTPGAVVGTLDSLTLLPPIEPGEIVVVEVNHIVSDAIDIMRGEDGDWTKSISYPPPSAVIGNGAAIVMPAHCDELRFNPALAVVIGKRTQQVARESVSDHILGLTCATEVFAPGAQPSDARGLATFLPLGPVITLGPLRNHVTIQARVNGETKYRMNTALWNGIDVSSVIADDCRNITLDPGDVVLIRTNNYEGPIIGTDIPVHSGDMIEVKIRGIGVLLNPVVTGSTVGASGSSAAGSGVFTPNNIILQRHFRIGS